MLFTSTVLSAGFLQAIDDLPLMQGLSEMPEKGLEFDKPGGRIVESVAGGNLTQPQIIEFYRRALPQLGWQQADSQPTSFVRDNEWLSIDFPPVDPGEQTLVRFRITPRHQHSTSQ